MALPMYVCKEGLQMFLKTSVKNFVAFFKRCSNLLPDDVTPKIVKKFEKWIKNNFSFNLSINFENTK
jgi:hypothetical protein